ncbi:hypothetical protein [Leptospira santarosai]|uniref:hypothetical protein n=1 Tax=Leptospira santarosai TaxID=28183 RepID=UPI0007746420|nr:hypothetical protein [Leptospira santarosai]MDI7198025.1 hypothetical protein [Leptospira santarosai]MDI7204424.1 hypothetical protein [Leptospira santarosai]
MKYSKYLIYFFVGMAVAFFLSFLNEALNPEPHEGALLFNSFAWYSSVFLVGVVGLIVSKVKVEVL